MNTLLSDIAVACPEIRDEIILNQVETLNTLTTMIKSSREGSSLPPLNLCKATVPILLGLGRSMGRYAYSHPPLLCRLFPRQEMPTVKPKENITPISAMNERHYSFSQFRSIIPRSLSGGLSTEALDDYRSSTDDLDGPDKKERPSLQTYNSVPYDPTKYFFAKYGSSFNQFPNMRFNETLEKKSKIQFPIQHLQTIFAIAKKILTKELLEHLDEQASDIYSLHQIKSYGYKSFSETINLVMVTLLRELLQNQNGTTIKNSQKARKIITESFKIQFHNPDLPTPFTKDVQEFVKRLFLIGQTELQNKQNDHEKEKREVVLSVNKYKINVMANAACVDLLVWAIADETGLFVSMGNISKGKLIYLKDFSYLFY